MFKLILLFWGLGTLFVAVNLLGGLARLSWISARSTPVASGDWRQTVRGLCAQLGIVRRVQVFACDNTPSLPPPRRTLRPPTPPPPPALPRSAHPPTAPPP